MPAYAYLRRFPADEQAGKELHDIEECAVRELAANYGDAEALIWLAESDTRSRRGIAARPGYRALQEAIEAGRATALYSYSFARLARSVAELSRLVALCTEKGISVRLVADHIDTSTASSQLVAQVFASVAKFEADLASERQRTARAAKLARVERLGATHGLRGHEWEEAHAFVVAFQQAGFPRAQRDR